MANITICDIKPTGKVNKHFQIQELEIQELRELSDKELNNVVGGYVTATGDVVDWPFGAGCPGGILTCLLY